MSSTLCFDARRGRGGAAAHAAPSARHGCADRARVVLCQYVSVFLSGEPRARCSGGFFLHTLAREEQSNPRLRGLT